MKSIMERVWDGEKLTDLHIIDMHCHMGPTNNYYFRGGCIEDMMADADTSGVEILCVSPHIGLDTSVIYGNEYSLDAIKKFPGRVYGMLMVNPNYPDECRSEIKKYYGMPEFNSFKIHPGSHGYNLNLPNYDIVFEAIMKQGGFVLTHTWEGNNCGPAQCEDVIKRFPGVAFIMAHAGGMRASTMKMIDLVNKYENAYIDTSGSEFSNVGLKYIMEHVDENKMFFGSDMPYHDMRTGLSRVLFCDIPDKVKEKLLGGNYRALMKKYPKK